MAVRGFATTLLVAAIACSIGHRVAIPMSYKWQERMNRSFISAPRHIRNRLTHLLAPVVLIVLVLVMLAALSFNILSSLRAFVTGESLWSKAQKESVAQMRLYVAGGEEERYRNAVAKLGVIEGDRAARLAIDREQPDITAAEAGFLAGGNHPDDISGMIWLYRYFRNAPHVDRAVLFWTQGDALIRQLRTVGERFHALRQRAVPDAAQRSLALQEIERIDAALMPVEEGFSTALGMASRLTLQALSVAMFLISAALLLVMKSIFKRLMQQSEQSRRDLALSEERLRLGFQGTNCGLWDWDIVSKNAFYSPWIYRLLEYDHDKMSSSGASFVEMVHPDDRAAAVAAYSAHIVHGTNYDVEFRLRTSTGKYLWVRSRAEAVRDSTGRAVRMVGSIFDISALKSAERQAFIERERAQVTLAAIADAVIRTDLDGRIDYCNAAAERLLGQSCLECCGQLLSSVCSVYEDHRLQHRIDVVDAVLSGAAVMYDNANLFLARQDGKVVAIDASAASVRDEAGHFFGAVLILHDVSSEREHAAQLAHQASHDGLTGLVNRREFERQIAALLALPAPARQAHAIMYLDLDQLKIINDSGGHAAGDQLIRQLSALLGQHLRAGDVLARLGGDEFGIMLRNCTPENAVRVAENLRQMIFDTRFAWEGKSYPTGLSIGLITEIDQFDSLNELMKVADAACFMAKEKGRNRVHCYSANDLELSLRHREIEWVARIGEALALGRFRLYAQRIVPAVQRDDDSQHVELLLRMVDADGGLVPPMSFIPAAERYNLMPDIDRWVIEAAFTLLAEAFANGVDASTVTCAINISGTSIKDEQFLDFILDQQRRHDIPFAAICLEITETAAIADLPSAAKFIACLRGFGCLFSLDDFGAGMSSFGYLKHLPVDFLKIDGSFVKDMLHNPIDRAMVEAINRIGHVMGKKTIAEFVENDAILACLAEIGVDYAQGYGIGKPEPFHAGFFPARKLHGAPVASRPAAREVDLAA